MQLNTDKNIYLAKTKINFINNTVRNRELISSKFTRDILYLHNFTFFMFYCISLIMTF